MYNILVVDDDKEIVKAIEIYLGKENQVFDLNYIGELRGKKSNIDIDVQGALKDTSKKHFKGTIDFKKGCKKSKGNENEYCTILSDKAKSIALPMLLCTEEDVEGNHSTAAGKIDSKKLFYLMTRGLSKADSERLIVRAQFNSVIEKIENEEIRNEILQRFWNGDGSFFKKEPSPFRKREEKMKVIVAAAGTAGHINPAISIANKIKQEQPNSEIIFIRNN